MKTGNAAVEILAEMLSKNEETLLNELEMLFNGCLVDGQIPTDWSYALVVLIYKNGDQEDPENNRPICYHNEINYSSKS